MLRLRLILLLAVSLLTSLCLAQGPVGIPGGGFEFDYNPALLMNPAVQKDMKVSPATANKAMGVMMEVGAAFQRRAQANGTANQADMVAAFKKMQTKIAALLTPAQKVRLRQLTLQFVGPAAVLQKRVANELHLTGDQKLLFRAQIQTIYKNAFATYARPTGNAPDAAALQQRMGEVAKRQAQVKTLSEAALAKLLTPPQKAAWTKMLGKKIPLTGLAGMGSSMRGM